MSIRIVTHCAGLAPAVEAFNQRMRAGGSTWGFYVEHEPDWIPKRPGQSVWREYYLAVDEGHAVRGGFVLKPQEWRIRGETKIVTDWQGPVSEGSVNPRFASLAVRLIREMTSRRPALYSWGHGGDEQPVVQMLRRTGWLMHQTPFCLMVPNPGRFLRLNGYLRTTALRRAALDFLAVTGTGVLGLHALRGLARLWAGRRFRATASEVAEFGPWANELWERCKDRYIAIAVRNAAVMNALAPATGWPPVTRLKIEVAGRTVGWALVMDTRMRDDWRFGNLHVGTIVDVLADPSDAGEVVAAAMNFLRQRSVDIIVSNQSHPAWIRGFAQNGCIILRNRRYFVASPGLRKLLEPFAETAEGLHLTNMDGHGPHAL